MFQVQTELLTHNQLRGLASKLDDERERYISIFEKATEGAAHPFDIRSALSRDELSILTAEDAMASGIIHDITT